MIKSKNSIYFGFGENLKNISLLKPAIFLAALLSFQNAFALSLKQPQVNSHFGEPLHIVIPLTMTAEEQGHSIIIQQMTPKPGGPLQVNKYQPKLDLLFELAVDENQQHQIIAYTVKPVNELILDLSLLVQAGPTRIVRQFSILLDPVAMPSTRKQVRRTTPPPPVPQAAPSRHIASAGYSTEPGTYVVQSGDSLSRIAQRFSGTTGLDSSSAAMVAIYEANPHAFVRGDADKIKLGYKINIPDMNTLEPTTWNQARKILYREKNQLVETPVRTTEPAQNVPAPQPAIKPRPPRPVSEPAAEKPDYKLKLLTSEEEAKYPAYDKSEAAQLVYQSPERRLDESPENVALKNKLRSQVGEMESQLTILRENIRKLEESLATTEQEMNTVMTTTDITDTGTVPADIEPARPTQESNIDLLRLLVEVLTLGAAVGFIFYLVSLRKRQTADHLFR